MYQGIGAVVQDYISPYRAKEAARIYEELQQMTTEQYLIDTAFAYLQSVPFFLLWFGTLFCW
jgi:hypothetical protein